MRTWFGRAWRGREGKRTTQAFRIALALSTVGGLIGASLGAEALARLIHLGSLDTDAPSPATGHAAVIAQGVSALPGADLAWRIVEDTAEAPGVAEPRERALGFTLPIDAPILVEDNVTGSLVRLAPGEAAFVAEAAQETRTSLASEAAPYYRLALTPAEQAQEAGDDALVFGGEPFAAPESTEAATATLFDLDLARDVLAAGEVSTLPATNAPALILATTGRIEVRPDGGPPVALSAGDAVSIPGDLTIIAGDDGASFVAATIGPAIPNPYAEPAESGSVSITFAMCAAGMTADNLDPDFCQTADASAFAVRLVSPDGTVLTIDDASTDEDGYIWRNVPFDDDAYTLEIVSLPAGYDDAVIGGPDGEILLSGESPTIELTIYALSSATADGATNGSIALVGRVCPDAASPDEVCQGHADAALLGATLLAEDDGTTYTLADASSEGAAAVWSGLPPDTYFLLAADLVPPAGYRIDRVRGTAGLVEEGYAISVNPTRFDVLVEIYLIPIDSDGAGDERASPDTDGDGLTDAQEAAFSTNPTLVDTDGDGLSDGDEVNTSGTSPLDPDSDNDGILDGQSAPLEGTPGV